MWDTSELQLTRTGGVQWEWYMSVHMGSVRAFVHADSNTIKEIWGVG